jgi:hypothetical protein
MLRPSCVDMSAATMVAVGCIKSMVMVSPSGIELRDFDINPAGLTTISAIES